MGQGCSKTSDFKLGFSHSGSIFVTGDLPEVDESLGGDGRHPSKIEVFGLFLINSGGPWLEEK